MSGFGSIFCVVFFVRDVLPGDVRSRRGHDPAPTLARLPGLGSCFFCSGFAMLLGWDEFAPGKAEVMQLLTLARTVSLPTFDVSLSRTIFRQTVRK